MKDLTLQYKNMDIVKAAKTLKKLKETVKNDEIKNIISQKQFVDLKNKVMLEKQYDHV